MKRNSENTKKLGQVILSDTTAGSWRNHDGRSLAGWAGHELFWAGEKWYISLFFFVQKQCLIIFDLCTQKRGISADFRLGLASMCLPFPSAAFAEHQRWERWWHRHGLTVDFLGDHQNLCPIYKKLIELGPLINMPDISLIIKLFSFYPEPA